MHYITFTEPEQLTYDIAILAPTLNYDSMLENYVKPFLPHMMEKVVAFDLHKAGKRTPVATQKEYLEDLLPALIHLKVKYLIVADAEYFKTLTKSGSVDKALGYVLPSIVGDFQVIYVPNYGQIFYDPDKTKAKITQCMTALVDHVNASYVDPGTGIVRHAEYPMNTEDIAAVLQRLLDMKVPLTADIEGFGLKHYECGIATISFAWNKHEGVAFPVDIREAYGPLEPNVEHERFFNVEVRALLLDFFRKYKENMTWHNITFDVYVLVYQLFMEDLLDTEGLLDGLDVMLSNWDDTKLITYLATNSCAGNKLGLKPQSQEFTGNYAEEDIKDIRKIKIQDLLEYNLIDALATWFVKEKHWDTMIEDQQEEIYQGLFKDAVVDIVQMQLTGIPFDRGEVIKVQNELQGEQDAAVAAMLNTQTLGSFVHEMRVNHVIKKNKEYKKKVITLADVDPTKICFNPASAPQLQELLYGKQYMALPVLDLTKSKLPATGAETLEKLINHTNNPDEVAFLKALIEYKSVAIILNTFIPAFLRMPMAPDGHYYLYGFFNLGGTVSGRLSSNDPNLQNIPASGATKAKKRIAKMIKRCVKAPKGFLFCGLDFASLEDRISAVTTRDPMKLKVYTDGFDGHCLRAHAYFGDKMPDIIGTCVQSVNSIDKLYSSLRQMSKAPTFALTYQGTYITLMANCGFSEELAKEIEARYHELYVVSDEWVAGKINQAGKDGYVTGAFGLRVRTPLLKQVILGNRVTPFEAAAEGRTAGNALGQSWCLLNSRAASEFMKKVRKSIYRLQIRPCAHIHDAQYFLIPDDMEVITWMNEHLVKAVQWQEHPDIANDDVKLGGELSIFYPDWSTEMTIPNGADQTEIETLATEHFEKYCIAA
jgi:DNA polymerase-1